MFNQLPSRLSEFLGRVKIGYLSTITPAGVLVHPVAYHCDGESILFGTPRGSAKLRWLKENPKVSFTVDNGKLMKDGMGVTVQGRAEQMGLKNITTSMRSALRATFGYIKKYPELLKYYVGSMDELPDDRKIYKYVFVRIHPTKIVYWDGYKFGKLSSKTSKPGDDASRAPQKPVEVQDPVVYAKYVKDYHHTMKSVRKELQEEGDLPAEQLAGDLFSEEMYLDALKDEGADLTTLLSLPDPLRKTGIAVLKLKKATLDQVVAETSRSHAEEKNALNRLAMMGLLKRRKEDDKMVFYMGE